MLSSTKLGIVLSTCKFSESKRKVCLHYNVIPGEMMPTQHRALVMEKELWRNSYWSISGDL